MSVFKDLKSDGLEESQDRLGGFTPLDTDIYTGKVKVAYAGISAGGARNITLILALANGREYRETIYVTDTKGQNFFLNRDDKTKKVPLPGFTIMDEMAMILTGKALFEQDDEEKVVKVYDYDAKKEVPTNVPVLIDFTDKEISVSIINTLKNKAKKDSSGKYVDQPESRNENNIAKVFHTETKLTVPENRKGMEKGEFWDAWLTHNKGKVQDKRTIKDGVGGTSGKPPTSRAAGAPPQATGSGQPARKSLFGSK